MERGTEYKVNDVWFDGYDADRKVLLDAKDWERYPPADVPFWEQKTLKEATGQLKAAPGTKIEWSFSTQKSADAVSALLKEEKILGITTVVTPK